MFIQYCEAGKAPVCAAVTTESRSFLPSASTLPARGLTTPPLLSSAAGCPNSSLRSLYTYTPTPTPHSHPLLFVVVVVTESRGSRLRGSVGLCSRKLKTPPAQLQYLSELQSGYLEPFFSDRNALWTPSNLTSGHFFLQNNTPAMFSAPRCYISSTESPCLISVSVVCKVVN